VIRHLKEGNAMYQLIQSISRQDLLRRQLPALMTAFVLAEIFYKFHSFTLECAAFLATWFALDWIGGRLLGGKQRPSG
jgi:hypothetical protein